MQSAYGWHYGKRSLMAIKKNFKKKTEKFKKSVSYQKKDGDGHACPSLFWYDNDTGHKGPFCVTPPIFAFEPPHHLTYLGWTFLVEFHIGVIDFRKKLTAKVHLWIDYGCYKSPFRPQELYSTDEERSNGLKLCPKRKTNKDFDFTSC